MAVDRVAVCAIAGTRPELLKLWPVIARLRESRRLSAVTCFSGQHVELMASVLGDVDVVPDIDLRAPLAPQSLSGTLAALIAELDRAVESLDPAGILVQGDTSTTLAGALVGFHRQLPVFHVEAGLRTSRIEQPFPEEMNRRLVSRVAQLHFAPTEGARQHLLDEKVPDECVEVTGNTIVDAMASMHDRLRSRSERILSRTAAATRKILVTLHRRENAGAASAIARAARQFVADRPDVELLWVLHENEIRQDVEAELRDTERIHLLPAQPYGVFLSLLSQATLVWTDSGGVQEEAPALGVPVLVMRDETERPEAVDLGVARLVGNSGARVTDVTRELLDDPAALGAMRRVATPFGDGRAARRIVAALERFYGSE